MNNKSDMVAIFESYRNYIKEQDESGIDPVKVMVRLEGLIKRHKSELGLDDAEINKLLSFLTPTQNEAILELYKNFQPSPMKMQSSPAEGDASAVNMGKGGVLEVQPDGQYPQ
jgi:hypothetical protein